MLLNDTPLKILILEDSLLDVELIRAKIQKDINIIDQVAYDRISFHKALMNFKPDIVISDYSMPQFNGLEALDLLQKSGNSCPFIIVTGAIDEETAVACIKAGANDYLVKDRLTRLPSAIKQSIQQHRAALEKEATLNALEESVRNFQSLGKASPDYVLLINNDGFVKYSNREDFFEQKIKIGQNVFSYLDNDLSEKIRTGIDEAFKNGKNKAFTIRFLYGGQKPLFFRCKISLVFENDQHAEFMLLLNDITDIEEVKIDLECSHQRMADLLNRIEFIRDDEKKRISMEIHDQLGQELTANKLGLFYLKQLIANNESAIEENSEINGKIEDLIELSGNTIQTVRRIAHQLRPIILDDLGLIPAIEWMLKNFNNNTNILWRFSIDLPAMNFHKDFTLVAYRIVQETTTNILRHANASECSIKLLNIEERFLIEISDNGKGFDTKLKKGKGKLGLFGIQERIKVWKGDLTIRSSKNSGSRVTVSFPKKLILINHDKCNNM